MNPIERGLYVTVGAADLAAEKVRDVPALSKLRERSQQLRERSVIERARELEPRLRQRSDELQKRGEKALKRARARSNRIRSRAEELPEEARKQLADIRSRVVKAVEGLSGNGQKSAQATRSKPSSKTSASSKAS